MGKPPRCFGNAPQAADLERPSPTPPLQRVFEYLRQRTRHDFSMYKPATVQRRIERRMNIHGAASLEQYADHLEANPQEVDLLFKELLIGVTRFFRDSEVWEHLVQKELPQLLEQRLEKLNLRAWVVGCSTGEEAYSLAMVFAEAIAETPHPHAFTLQIFASDLSPDAIAIARRGQYPLSIRSSVSPERLTRFFDKRESHFQVKKHLRDTVLFAQHDVVLDPPFTKLDLIACRNLLIYFDPMLQRSLMPLFHYSLGPGGILVLGSSESVGRFHRVFEPIHSRLRIYRRHDDAPIAGLGVLLKSLPPLSRIEKEHAVPSSDDPSRSSGALQQAADDVLLQVYAPAAVLLNADGDIVYISGRTGKYLEAAAGKANWNIHAMAREGLRSALMGVLAQAKNRREPLQLRGVKIVGVDGVHRVDVTVQGFQEAGPLYGMSMVIFRDAALGDPAQVDDEAGAGDTVEARSADIQHYRDEIETLREEARASRERLQISNDELQSTNEELQSTNEELTTSKEEMQSMNEELQTINSELQAKLDDLALAQSDMQNVLNSIEIAILFLDQNLNVRRFTDRASKIINLRDSDVGRPISDLTTALQYPDMHKDAHQTLRSLTPSEKQVEASDGRSFSVRIMPYRRIDNVIDGVVITLLDVSGDRAKMAARD
jgi:two-component system CheB/CheR fusion protein